MTALHQELEALLALDPDQVVKAQRHYWANATGARGGRILLFGAGALGRWTLAGLRRAGLDALAFLDNDAQKHGKIIDGLTVLDPRDAVARYGDSATFVVATYNTSAPRRQLAAHGAAAVVPFPWLFASMPETFLPHGCLELPHPIFEQAADVRCAFDLMADDEMRQVFLSQLRWRLFLDFDRVPSPQTPSLRDSEYFPDDLYTYRPDEVLVDCGAFDGDTARRFLSKRGDAFKKIHACEPDPDTRFRFQQWSASLPFSIQSKISLEPVAVGAHPGRARFSATGTAGSAVLIAGSSEIEVATIDDLTRATPPTLIKMDVEGAELDALAGARDSIQQHTPVLAICIYHASDHLWRVPLLIASMSPEYSFFLRAHAEDCWDVSCYAVPKDRVVKI
ncbi:MAG: FkbM family methyltransferase [Holophaga sp.]